MFIEYFIFLLQLFFFIYSLLIEKEDNKSQILFQNEDIHDWEALFTLCFEILKLELGGEGNKCSLLVRFWDRLKK